MIPYSLTSEARGDLRLIRVYYDSQKEGLGNEFLDEFEVAIGRICRDPQGYDPLGKSQYRRIIMDRFPYAIVYLVVANAIEVAVVVHTKRRTVFWRKRLKT